MDRAGPGEPRGLPLCAPSDPGEPQPPTVRWWESSCAGSLAESMTESETDLRPALRRDEIMPVGSFWFSRTFLGYYPPVPKHPWRTSPLPPAGGKGKS